MPEGICPTNLFINNSNAVNFVKLAIEAGISMGVVNGVVKGDMVLTSEGPKVIEIATRLSRGWFSSDQIPLNSGIHIIEYAIKIALNINFSPTDLVPKINNGVAIRYFFPNEGQISKIENLDILLDKDYIYKFDLYVKEGDYIRIYNYENKEGIETSILKKQNRIISVHKKDDNIELEVEGNLSDIKDLYIMNLSLQNTIHLINHD